MIEYINLGLFTLMVCTILFIYFRLKKYVVLLKMVDTGLDQLIALESTSQQQPSQNLSVDKKEKLLQCISSGQSKLLLGKIYTEEQLNKLNEEQLNKLFASYESKLSRQMVESIKGSIINLYSRGVCLLFDINNPHELTDQLKEDPYLDSGLQHVACHLYYTFGGYLAPVSLSLITAQHYLKNYQTYNKNGEEQSTTSDSSNLERSEES